MHDRGLKVIQLFFSCSLFFQGFWNQFTSHMSNIEPMMLKQQEMCKFKKKTVS